MKITFMKVSFPPNCHNLKLSLNFKAEETGIAAATVLRSITVYVWDAQPYLDVTYHMLMHNLKCALDYL